MRTGFALDSSFAQVTPTMAKENRREIGLSRTFSKAEQIYFGRECLFTQNIFSYDERKDVYE
jgi:hypothetical protein